MVADRADLAVRPASVTDVDAVARLLVDCWQQSYADFLPASVIARMTLEVAAERWHAVLADGAPAAVATTRDDSPGGEIVGVTRWTADVEPHTGYVDSLYVSPQVQGGGIGGRLLEHAVVAIAAGGATTVRLDTFEGNIAAIDFYRRHGFELDGTRHLDPTWGPPRARATTRAGSVTTPALQHFVDDAVADDGPPGMAVAVARNDQIEVAVAGCRTVGASGARPMTVETRHDLASVTKAFTTTALMRLVAAGQFDLDESVRRHVPSFSGAGKDDVTVRDLLLHRGGLWEWWPLYLATPSGGDAVTTAATLPLRHRPATARHYSDLGFVLLGAVVESVTGISFAAALDELVIVPSGLTATGFGPITGDDVAASSRGDEVERRMVASGEPYPVPFRSDEFAGWRTHVLMGEVNDGNAHHACAGVSAHAGLFSTIGDLVRFGACIATGADAGWWSAELADEFFAAGPDPGQALGFRRYPVTTAGPPLVVLGHPGFVGCAVGFAPATEGGSGLAVAMAGNRLLAGGHPPATTELWERLLAEVMTTVGSQAAHS